ncbi:MAG: V-type ATP synthase subunit F [Chloroflexi bacterium]|nr:V-type ATP synthase subunit F [Chloroflexota bacterium]
MVGSSRPTDYPTNRPADQPTMSRLVVIADAETALGFQLAGVQVVRAEDAERAQTLLYELLNDASVGLIAVSGALMERFDDATRRRVETSYAPVVVSLPTGGPAMGFASRREYLAALIRRAIGFHITFPGEEKGK